MNDQSAAEQLSAVLAGFATEQEVAAALGVTGRTLRERRQKGEGPAWTRFGRKILYPIPGVRELLEGNTRQPVRTGRGRAA